MGKVIKLFEDKEEHSGRFSPSEMHLDSLKLMLRMNIDAYLSKPRSREDHIFALSLIAVINKKFTELKPE